MLVVFAIPALIVLFVLAVGYPAVKAAKQSGEWPDGS